MRNKLFAVLALVAILLAACARPANEVLPTVTPILCDVRVDGRWVVGPAGKPLILYGASLPTLTKMEKSNYPVADRLHDELNRSGIDTILDDRDARPGFKFADADLLGMPLRLTVSPRTLAKGGVELKLRREKEFRVVPREVVLDEVKAALAKA